ncbi:MAG: hypothetical protein WB919_01050 [Candidatus Sulfotelmatobacter sp.]
MEADTVTKVKISILNTEMDNLHFANGVYWKRGIAGTLEARAEHKRRQDRLEEVRAELYKLQKSAQ